MKTDDIFKSPHWLRLNPHKNAPRYDLCVREVPLSKIKPELLKDPSALTTAFCAGMWSGKGYAVQRLVLAQKDQGPKTAHQLWSHEQLASSDYAVGTQLTDHFEVLEKTPEKIIARGGGSPLVLGVRESDGLVELGTRIDRENGMAVFRLKCMFFQGEPKVEGGNGPFPDWVLVLHRMYAKILVETAIWNCMKRGI